MTHNRIGHGPDPAKDEAILSDLLQLEQSAYQCRSIVNTELQTPAGADCAQLCAQDLLFSLLTDKLDRWLVVLQWRISTDFSCDDSAWRFHAS
jgi:hypothetical protein